MTDTPLRRADLHADPVEQFRAWQTAHATTGARHATAAALATATADGAPSARMVLVKRVDADGFTFFTHAEGRKGRELAENPRAALLYHWDDRQVRVEGRVTRVADEASDAYWGTRPPASRFSAAATVQGTPVADRAALERAVADLQARHPDGDVPRPPAWGGYRLVPTAFEFWQHRENRLHDRFTYTREGDAWRIRRLAP